MTRNKGCIVYRREVPLRHSLIGLYQSGATTVEYVVATAVVVAMLFLPIPGQSESVMEVMVQAFKENHHGYVWGMSYPL